MEIKISIPERIIKDLVGFLKSLPFAKMVVIMASVMAVLATAYSFFNHLIIAYGDAESHLNIAKRVVSSLTPGFAQLGGIWLPLPHLLMVPFVIFDPLWRTGLAGSIVSGICFIVASFFIYKLTLLITNNKYASFLASLVFITNINILYMQSTPMTELPLIAFMTLTTYYFVLYLRDNTFNSLLIAAFWGFCASLSRYDGWFIVLTEVLIIFLHRFPYKRFWENIKARGLTLFPFLSERGEGEMIIFSTLALIGIVAWFVWGFVILGDPLYFTNSQFSAKSQQHGFLVRGELPAFKNFPLSFLYYSVTSMSSVGIIIFAIAIVGLVVFSLDKKVKDKLLILLLFMSPFIFYVVTLYLGQSVIFIPDLTPVSFEWRLFNVRYGLVMVPAIAILVGYLFSKIKNFGKILLITLIIANMGLYVIGYTRVLALEDGLIGLSHSSHPDAEFWLRAHYDNGLAILDDYARTMSIIGSGIPMQNIVYVEIGRASCRERV